MALTTPVVECSVVKRAFSQSLSNRLDKQQREKLVDYVEQCTDIATRMARRSSLAFLYYTLKRLESGRAMPDFMKATDTYWLEWMRIGLVEYGHPELEQSARYPNLVLSSKYNGPPLQSEEDKAIDKLIFAEIDELLGTTLGPTKRDIPKYFDRIVGHLAVQLSTAVKNCLKVNFFAKLKRVFRYEVAEAGVKGFSGYDLLVATCRGGASGADKPLPEALRPFVDSVRDALGLQDKKSFVVEETTAFDFPTRFAVHWLMQQRLAAFGRRKLMLSPVFKVQRQHVRLDATHLALLMNDFLWTPAVEKVDKMKPADRSKCPTKAVHPDLASFKAAKAAWTVEKSEHAKLLAAYKEAKADLGMSPLYKIEQGKPIDPEAQLIAEVPIPSVKRPGHLAKSDPIWTNELLPEQQRRRDNAVRERSTVRQTEEFREASREYKAYEARLHCFGLGMFRDFKDRNPKLGWAPSGSVVTDGVSLCVTYERTVERVNKTCKEATDEFALHKQAKRKAAKDAAELEPCDDYDVDASTCFGDALVLGVDPGRVCLVTIICIDAHGVKTSWRLTRGQFHTESGILRQNKLQSRRYTPLAADFASLTRDGGALRASSSDEVRKYVVEYRKFEEKWFTDVALKRRESRSKLQRFIGKQKTLASFFSRVRKEAEEVMVRSGKTRIEVAYGACGPTMAPTGRGELAVPTKGWPGPRPRPAAQPRTYGACVQAFTRERESDGWHSEPSTSKHTVSLENEDYTSQTCWYTGKKYEKVYKKYDAAGKEFLHHTTNKDAPLVGANEDVEAVLKKRAEQKAKASKRRGGDGTTVPLAPILSADARDVANKVGLPQRSCGTSMTRHIAVRGLLFCPESRMFFARDDESARAIAGLRCIRLAGLGRPSAFRRKSAPPVQGATKSLRCSSNSSGGGEGGCDLAKGSKRARTSASNGKRTPPKSSC